MPEFRSLVLDLDGVVYVGNRPVRGVAGFLRRWREKGGKVVFVTNNSSLSREGYAEKLRKMEISAS
ncbi:MAG: hypothetical protein QW084_02950, partial [Candidatus Hadarchaeales archaeon]